MENPHLIILGWNSDLRSSTSDGNFDCAIILGMSEIVGKECPIVENEFRIFLEVKVTRNWVNESFLGFKGLKPFSLI